MIVLDDMISQYCNCRNSIKGRCSKAIQDCGPFLKGKLSVYLVNWAPPLEAAETRVSQSWLLELALIVYEQVQDSASSPLDSLALCAIASCSLALGMYILCL